MNSKVSATGGAQIDMEPCPFCGGAAHVTKGEAIENVWPHGTFYRVFCASCQCRQLFHRTKAEAIEAWNSRALARAGQQAGSARLDANQWSKKPPTEQADYWHWDGNEDSAPMIYHVLWSGSANKCFVSIGQYDITSAIWCDEFGGWWMKIERPSIPAAHQASAQADSDAKGGEA